MKKNLSIPLKAAFLLTVFSLNTIIGFGWSFGIHVCCHSCHQQEPLVKPHLFCHVHDKAKDNESKGCTKPCCCDLIIKLFQVDKTFNCSFTNFKSGYPATFISSFYNVYASNNSKSCPAIKFFIRRHHPPAVPDIRIAIQSLQV
jgi:hypothetical protein